MILNKLKIEEKQMISPKGGPGFWTIALGTSLIASSLISILNLASDNIHSTMETNSQVNNTQKSYLHDNPTVNVRLSKYPSKCWVTMNNIF